MTLYTALVTIAKTAAPMIPFMTEEIYRNLVCSIDASAPESVHLCDFPEVKEAWIDPELEANMDLVLKIVVMGRACRNSANIKNRQPIGQMYVKAEKTLPDYFVDIIGDELNVKKVDFTEDVSAFTTYTSSPSFGPWDRSTANSWAVSRKRWRLWMETLPWRSSRQRAARSPSSPTAPSSRRPCVTTPR